jgi:hypothetical protein
MYKFAVLVDNLFNTPQTKVLMDLLLANKHRDITIFSIVKERCVSSPLPVFSIVDYFNWKHITIITSPATLEKAISYGTGDTKLILGQLSHENCINIPTLDFNLIQGILDGKT